MRSQGKAVLIVLLILVAVVLAIGVSAVLMLRGDSVVAKQTVLELDLTQAYPEYVPDDAFARSLLDGRLRLRRVTELLDRAASDDDIVGIVAKTGSVPMGLAAVQELRDALTRFRASGKTMVAYAETFGEFGPSSGGYYLASAFDRIYLQPSGDVGITGLSYEIPFAAETLEKLGLEPRLGRRHEYKNAVNTYTESEFTEAHEEAMQALVDSQFDQLVAGIASARSLPPDEVRDVFDNGPYYGAEALDAGLVDGLAYRDEVYATLEEELGKDVTYLELDRYGGRRVELGERAKVALIYGVGGVVRGESRYDPMSGMLMGSETVAKAFRSAVEDPEVDAILFRVNSPGGSYVASDTIWRETVRSREAGKPVVVSMGNLAASGGYFVSMSADRIVAQPGTITGSIGVYGGKIVSQVLWKKLGVSWDAVESSPNARMWSSLSDFDEQGWDRLQDSLDRIYDDFVSKVAEGRKLAREDVEAVAKGRIWTGEAALEHGLVDRLGGYPVALEEVRAVLGLAEDARLELEVFPRPRSTFELLVERLSSIGSPAPSPELVKTLLGMAAQIGQALRDLGIAGEGQGPLTAPGFESTP